MTRKESLENSIPKAPLSEELLLEEIKMDEVTISKE
jgi:hypothetical protein